MSIFLIPCSLYSVYFYIVASKLAEKKDEFEAYRNRIQNYDNGTQVIEKLEQKLDTDAEYQLPEPPALMSAKSYKMKFVEPLIKKFKEVITRKRNFACRK